MNRTLGAVASLLLTAGLAAGCGDDEPSSTPESTGSPSTSVTSAPPVAAVPATGPTLRGTGYSFRAPKGWQDTSQGAVADVSASKPITAVKAVRDNVTVVVKPASGQQLSTYETTAAADLKDIVSALRVLPRVSIDGEVAAHVSGRGRNGQAAYHFEQYAIVLEDTLYACTFAIDATLPPRARRALIDSVLVTWRWTA